MWRDRIQVHPAADRFPMMSRSELQELASDITENGLRTGIVLWTPVTLADATPGKSPKEIYLLDGRNRLEAIELGCVNDHERVEAIEDALYIDPTQPGTATLLYGDEDPLAYVVSANIRRRHLTAEQKREIIAELLKSKPERSDRATASITGVSDHTVASVRADLEAGAQIAHHDKRVGSDGVVQPARKPAAPKAEPDASKVVTFPASAAPQPTPAPPAREPLNDTEIVERQVDALTRAWNAAGPEARATFLARIERPVFDNTRAGRKQ